MPNTARRLLARLLSRLIGCRAFSSEVETGSRQENASNQGSRAPFRFYRNGKGSRVRQESPTNQGRRRYPPPSFCFCRGRPVLARIIRNVRALPFAVLLIVATALPVMAGPFQDAVGKFANDEFSDTEEAVGAIATSGSPLAYRIISALQDGRLLADPDSKTVYVTEPVGT